MLVGCRRCCPGWRGPLPMPPPVRAASQLVSPRTACAGGPRQPCSGNGRCDGDGTRRGTGLCVCSPGYGGPFCAECGDGYYEASRNKSHLVCAGKLGSGLAGRRGCAAGGLPWCCPSTGCRQLPPACSHARSPLPAECYRACGRCTGPEDSSCLRCKRGWVLHEHRCIGEGRSGTGGTAGKLGDVGGCVPGAGAQRHRCPPPLSQTLMSAARRWRTAEPTSSVSTRRAPTSAEVRWRWGVSMRAGAGWAGRGLWW